MLENDLDVLALAFAPDAVEIPVPPSVYELLTLTDVVNCPAACPGDINLDGTVGIVDLLVLLGAYGACP